MLLACFMWSKDRANDGEPQVRFSILSDAEGMYRRSTDQTLASLKLVSAVTLKEWHPARGRSEQRSRPGQVSLCIEDEEIASSSREKWIEVPARTPGAGKLGGSGHSCQTTSLYPSHLNPGCP